MSNNLPLWCSTNPLVYSTNTVLEVGSAQRLATVAESVWCQPWFRLANVQNAGLLNGASGTVGTDCDALWQQNNLHYLSQLVQKLMLGVRIPEQVLRRHFLMLTMMASMRVDVLRYSPARASNLLADLQMLRGGSLAIPAWFSPPFTQPAGQFLAAPLQARLESEALLLMMAQLPQRIVRNPVPLYRWSKQGALEIMEKSANYAHTLKQQCMHNLQDSVEKISSRVNDYVPTQLIGRDKVDSIVENIASFHSQTRFNNHPPMSNPALTAINVLTKLENKIRAFDGVDDVAVLAGDADAEQHSVVAYLVAQNSTPVFVEQLKHYLSTALPITIFPTRIILMDLFPRTSDGRIDRLRLASTHLVQPDEPSDASPRDPIEKSLGGVWKSLLGVEHVGIHESFFDLGGYSITAIRLHKRLKQLFSVSLPIKAIFQYPTIALLATYIKRVIQ